MKDTGPTNTTLLGFVVVVGTLVALWTGERLFDGQPHDEELTVVFVGALLLALGSWVVQALANRLAAVQVGLVMALVSGLWSGALLWSGDEPHPLALALAVTSGFGFAAGMVFFVRSQWGTSVAGNPLAGLFRRGPICELGGMQFTVVSTATDFGGALCFFIQNCFDAPREMDVTLDITANGERATRQARVTLGPLGIVRADFPIAVPPDVLGGATVEARLEARGSEGHRVRTWIARTYENATSERDQLGMLLVLGVVKWGGGIKVRFGPGITKDAPSPLPAVVDLANDPAVRAAIRSTGGPA